MQKLEELFEDVLANLPTEPEARITLNASNCPSPPLEIVAQDLKVVAWPLGHIYEDSARYDLIHFFADRTTYRRLGLLLFASIFHPNRQIELYPKHAESNVTRIRLSCSVPDISSSLLGLASIPMAYGYEAAPVGHIHPLWREEWRIEGHVEKGAGRSSY